MRWYPEVQQQQQFFGSADKCPVCKSNTCRNSPTIKEWERSKVLEISRWKNRCIGSSSIRDSSSQEGIQSKVNRDPDLRKMVTVRNTMKRLEKDIHAEILKAFAMPASMA